MEKKSIKNLNLKKTSRSQERLKGTSDEEEYMDTQEIPEPGVYPVIRLSRSDTRLSDRVFPALAPPAKKKKYCAPQGSDQGKRTEIEKELTIEKEKKTIEEDEDALGALRAERKNLESFLFNENNKISKMAIKYILEKWSVLENRLQDEYIEHEKLKVAYRSRGGAPAPAPATYARVVGGSVAGLGSPPEKEKVNVNQKRNEVILIKPINDNEKRTNEEIRKVVTDHLKDVKSRLKVVSVRQMRNHGLVMELDSKKDVELVEKSEISTKGLKIERPKKMDPSLIIYDVEQDYEKEEMITDLLSKNFGSLSDEERTELGGRITVRTSFRGGEGKVNWVVQMPGGCARALLKEGRAFMRWRTYKVKEFNNITRCYECNAFGHIAKVCTVRDLMCGICASGGHLAKDCKSEMTRCSNCVRMKRREVNHHVSDKKCPEYLRQVQIYNSKIKWD